MKPILIRILAIVSAILVCFLVAINVTTEKALAQSCSWYPPPELTASIPVNPQYDEPSCPEPSFGDFAWKTFVALNWPANCDGQPSNLTIGLAPEKPRVWEFYNSPEDVFLPNGAKPDLQPVIPPQCLSTNLPPVPRKLRLTEFASNPIFQPNNLKLDKSLSILQPAQKPLVDRVGNYIINEVMMNPVEVNQIMDKGWYSADNFIEFINPDNPFQLMCSHRSPYGYPTFEGQKVPCTDNESEGTIELKAAWMVLPPPNTPGLEELHLPNPAEYYTTTRTLFVKTPENEGETTKFTVDVALVGFHIVHKTSKQGWVWATFEHKDNAPTVEDGSETPDLGDIPPSGYYNLYNPNVEGETNEPFVKLPYLWGKQFPYAVTRDRHSGQIKQQIPSQITRLIPIGSISQTLNEKWQKKLAEVTGDKEVTGNSVWQNYQLIGVQWLQSPTKPYDNDARDVRPPNRPLANVTLEPYIQKSSSCVDCHTKAHLPIPSSLSSKEIKADFSFLMKHAKPSKLQAHE